LRSISRRRIFIGTCRARIFAIITCCSTSKATQILGTTDTIAERVRKLGGQTIKSIGHIGRLQRVRDNDAEEVAARDMLTELLDDNRRVAEQMLKTHALCDETSDVASASLIEVWIDEAQGRAWFLQEAVQRR
jgi:starvation-inducible DNA-binding protein